ncbi:DUF4097 family beta strand repeat-containing protein [Amycolatopsis palatopharyngis]|uniref:DUF4097 family beta strand repeat-containing protein n=1 Tax=Amycolatopsis palatopharyngis TaxID=187982 RepID=UPI000E286D73|nr:DUF4097 family beta strand repeat-containing protein [Amycolatopsis palatopharyngis]
MGRTGLAIGGVAMIGIGVSFAFGLWSYATAEATDEVGGVNQVLIDNDSGNVAIRVGDVRSTTVHQRFEYRWGEPDGSISVDEGKLELGDCGSWCSVDYDVVVPEGTEISGTVQSGDLELTGVASAEVDAASGDVTVRQVAGPVRVVTSSGDVRLNDIGGPVDAELSSGDLTGEGLRGPVDAQVSSGNIRLVMMVPQSVTADASSGDIHLTVPDQPYRLEGDSDSGDRTIGVAQSRDSRHTLRLDAASGDVTVRTS